MEIELRRLIPFPVVEIPHEDSDIWEKETVVLEQGKFCLLTAASGKGKTSLLSILYGIRKDYRGEALVDGTDIRTFNDRQWARLRKRELSCIFQGLELFDELSAFDNIQVKNRQTGHYPSGTIVEMARKLEMDHFLDRPAGILSYGQKQRVAIIRALCQPFSFLFADEIFSHLDNALGEKAFALVTEECRQRHAGLLFTGLAEPEGFSFDIQFRI